MDQMPMQILVIFVVALFVDTEPAGLATGTVKWFNSEKGFGFIARDDGKPDVYFHYSAVVGGRFRPIDEGARVSFTWKTTIKGDVATSVTELGVDGLPVKLQADLEVKRKKRGAHA